MKRRKPKHYRALLAVAKRIDKDFSWAVHPALHDLRTILNKLSAR